MGIETYDGPKEVIKEKTPEQDIQDIEARGNFGFFLDNLEQIDTTQLNQALYDIVSGILDRSKSENNGIMDDVDYLIGKNIPSETNIENLEKNLTIAIDSSLKEILKEYKNIPTGSQIYKNAIQETKSNNLKTKIEGLKTIYLLANTAEGFSDKSNTEKIESTKDLYREDYIDRILYVKDIINDLKRRIKKEEIDTKQKELLAKNLELRKIELGELEKGDIFTGTKIEKNENISQP